MIQDIALNVIHLSVVLAGFSKLAEHVPHSLNLTKKLELFLLQGSFETSRASFSDEVQKLALGLRILVLALGVAVLEILIEVVPQSLLHLQYSIVLAVKRIILLLGVHQLLK